MEDPVVILGAGHGGSQVGFSLRQEGYEGRIVLLSDEPDLPYHKPPLSKAYLKDPAQEPQILRAEKAYDDARIERLFGEEIAAIDPAGHRIATASGTTLAYSKLVIATGARNRQLAVEGSDLDGIFSLRTLNDARRLRAAMAAAKNVVVIGGGFIGLEAASTFAALGKTVTVLEMAPRILGRAVSPDVSLHAEAVHRAAGIRILTETGIGRLLGTEGRVSAVETTTGETIAADLVLVGIGAIPNDELAREAGLACRNGILVDEAFRTSDPDIYAIGDVAAYHHWLAGREVRLESVQNANDQAKFVAKSLLGHPVAYREVPWFWSDQGTMKLQMTGLSFDPDRYLVSGKPEDNAFSVYHFRAGRLIAVDSVNRPADHMIARRMIAMGFTPTDGDIALGPHHLKDKLAGAVPA